MSEKLSFTAKDAKIYNDDFLSADYIKENSIDKEKEIMTVKQLAEYLQITEHTVYSSSEIASVISRDRLSRSGQIPSIKTARQWLFEKEVIDKWFSDESMERVIQNIKSVPKKKGEGNNL